MVVSSRRTAGSPSVRRWAPLNGYEIRPYSGTLSGQRGRAISSLPQTHVSMATSLYCGVGFYSE